MHSRNDFSIDRDAMLSVVDFRLYHVTLNSCHVTSTIAGWQCW